MAQIQYGVKPDIFKYARPLAGDAFTQTWTFLIVPHVIFLDETVIG